VALKYIQVALSQVIHIYVQVALRQVIYINVLVATIYIQVVPSAHMCDVCVCTSDTRVHKNGTHISISGTQSCHSHIYM